jgi:hypothetical protein
MPTRNNSQSRLQDRAIKSGFLDLTGDAKSDFGPVSLDSISQVLTDIAIEYVLAAQNNLLSSDAISSGALNDSIIPTEVQVMGSRLRVDINIADYYRFVDKGVSGWQTGGSSPYSFKKGGIGPNSPMVKAIRKWVIKEGLKQRASNVNKPISVREGKRMNRKITDTSTQTAIAISQGIRKKGLKATNFWTKTGEEMQQVIKDRFGRALKVFVIENLSNGNSNKS